MTCPLLRTILSKPDIKSRGGHVRQCRYTPGQCFFASKTKAFQGTWQPRPSRRAKENSWFYHVVGMKKILLLSVPFQGQCSRAGSLYHVLAEGSTWRCLLHEKYPEKSGCVNYRRKCISFFASPF
ncbi:hypothetical protein KIL84_007446 [Mauremys mutica]|uniref:Uncharacterized protein n=1 Tax=Mauremys mutica TaxID=74926 RepID=A0A9D3X366_9SAUR|nr:hypothetical protein KIL84_007446 [Mauremys mutica]